MTGKSRTLALVAFLTALVTGTGLDPFQTLYRLNRQGNEAIEKQDGKTAIEKYSKALEMVPTDPRLLFNLAGAQAQAGQLEEARRNWERAGELGDKQLKRDALYNRGVAGLASKQFGPAVGDFARALNIDPADKEARRNLELALRQLQMQQQQQQNQQKDGDSSQDQKQPQQNQQSSESKEDQPQKGQDQKTQSQADRDDSSSPAGDQRQEKAQNEEQKMAERLLDSLQREETDALKRALRRRQAQERPREKDW